MNVDKATRTERVSAKGTKRGMNPSTNLGLVNSFGGSAFKPARPVRKDMDGLKKAISDLNEMVDKATRAQSMSQRAVKTGNKTRAGLVEHVREHGSERDNFNSPNDRDVAHEKASSRAATFDKSEYPAPRAKEKPAGKFDSWGRNAQPPKDKEEEMEKSFKNNEREHVRTLPKKQDIKKSEPITQEDMAGLSKSLLGLTEMVKSMDDVLKGTVEQNRAGRGDLRNKRIDTKKYSEESGGEQTGRWGSAAHMVTSPRYNKKRQQEDWKPMGGGNFRGESLAQRDKKMGPKDSWK